VGIPVESGTSLHANSGAATPTSRPNADHGMSHWIFNHRDLSYGEISEVKRREETGLVKDWQGSSYLIFLTFHRLHPSLQCIFAGIIHL
jgi:hypothetical protein